MKRIDVLVVGSGAREHALLWKLRQSPHMGALFAAPGNAGTADVAENVPIAATDLDGIVRFTEERDIALTVIGPEAPLALGLADRLREIGRRVVGPSAAAARIEASKSFAKDLMARSGVPTAQYAIVDESGPVDPWRSRGALLRSAEAACRYTDTQNYPLVVKADGLAAGKGVWICRNPEEAREAIEAMMVRRTYGAAGARLLIEEGLRGPEVSLIAFVDGERVVPLPMAQDHKRLLDGDLGPNTGGMGAHAPVPFLSPEEGDELARLLIQPVVAELAAAGTPYRGFLFAGLMLTDSGPRVLEYNCRLGDPEAQVILPLLADDLLPWLEAMADGTLMGRPAIREQGAVGVVLAAPGYPEKPRIGMPIEGLIPPPRDVLLFQAGTGHGDAGDVVATGGRVLTIVGTGATIEEAAERAYNAPVRFEGMQRRDDIGRQGFSLTAGRGRSLGHRRAPHVYGNDSPRGRRRIGVLASGAGSNLQALLDATQRGGIDAEVVVVVSHSTGAGAVTRAEKAGIAAFALPLIGAGDVDARRRHEDDVLALLQPFQLDLLVLAGWMLILSPHFLAGCPFPILNVHPALLPDRSEPLDVPILRGAHAVRDALALGLPWTGVSVHHVTEQVDAGPVVVREVVPIDPDDDVESLYRRIKVVEHRLLPAAVQTVLSTVYGGVHA